MSASVPTKSAITAQAVERRPAIYGRIRSVAMALGLVVAATFSHGAHAQSSGGGGLAWPDGPAPGSVDARNVPMMAMGESYCSNVDGVDYRGIEYFTGAADVLAKTGVTVATVNAGTCCSAAKPWNGSACTTPVVCAAGTEAVSGVCKATISSCASIGMTLIGGVCGVAAPPAPAVCTDPGGFTANVSPVYGTNTSADYSSASKTNYLGFKFKPDGSYLSGAVTQSSVNNLKPAPAYASTGGVAAGSNPFGLDVALMAPYITKDYFPLNLGVVGENVGVLDITAGISHHPDCNSFGLFSIGNCLWRPPSQPYDFNKDHSFLVNVSIPNVANVEEVRLRLDGVDVSLFNDYWKGKPLMADGLLYNDVMKRLNFMGPSNTTPSGFSVYVNDQLVYEISNNGSTIFSCVRYGTSGTCSKEGLKTSPKLYGIKDKLVNGNNVFRFHAWGKPKIWTVSGSDFTYPAFWKPIASATISLVGTKCD